MLLMEDALMDKIEAQIKLRCDTKSNWGNANPILAEGELGVIINGNDHGKRKD